MMLMNTIDSYTRCKMCLGTIGYTTRKIKLWQLDKEEIRQLKNNPILEYKLRHEYESHKWKYKLFRLS